MTTTVVLGWPIGDIWDRAYKTGSLNCDHDVDPIFNFCPQCGKENKRGDRLTTKTLKQGFREHNVGTSKQYTYHGYEVRHYPKPDQWWIIEEIYELPCRKRVELGYDDNAERGQTVQLSNDMVQVDIWKDSLTRCAKKDGHSWDPSTIGLHVWIDHEDTTR